MQTKKSSKRDAVLKKLGRNVRAVRRMRGLSQESLALAAGLDRSYVGGVERGERNIAVVNLLRLAKALAIPASTLLEDLR
ncbi:MAG: helix-turn-helix domain-containing protein [Planctomycetota bacterium]|jgi:transcriptional regulator with XRE-family HTH domain